MIGIDINPIAAKLPKPKFESKRSKEISGRIQSAKPVVKTSISGTDVSKDTGNEASKKLQAFRKERDSVETS